MVNIKKGSRIEFGMAVVRTVSSMFILGAAAWVIINGL